MDGDLDELEGNQYKRNSDLKKENANAAGIVGLQIPADIIKFGWINTKERVLSDSDLNFRMSLVLSDETDYFKLIQLTEDYVFLLLLLLSLFIVLLLLAIFAYFRLLAGQNLEAELTLASAQDFSGLISNQ